MRVRTILSPVALVVMSACVVVGDDAPAGDTGTERGTDTGTSSEGEGDGDGDPAPGDGDGEPRTGDGDGDPATGDGDGDEPACPSRDRELGVDYVLGGFDDSPLDVTWSCVTTSVSTNDGLHISLDCPDAPLPITIDIAAEPAISTELGLGDQLELRYVYDGPWWFNLYLRLDRMGGTGHVLTLVDGDALTPPAPVEFDLPLPITPRADLCARTSEFCGERERYGLEVEVDEALHTVLDGHHATLGPPPGIDVWVSEAGELHEISCTDTPTHWYEILIVSPG